MIFSHRTGLLALFRLLLALPLLWCALARAQLTVEISGAGANRIAIAIADFPGEASLPQGIAAVVRADLERSGLFKLIPVASPMAETADVSYPEWRNRGSDALVVGSILPASGGRFEARFKLYDVQKGTVLLNSSLFLAPNGARRTAHLIADQIYEKLLGEPGSFATRIAYVVKSGYHYELRVADADGAGAQTALASPEPIISPTWSPDGTRLAYVSFEKKKPMVFIHSLTTGQRYVAANFKGSNSAPAWAPDSSKLAVVLTKDGGSQLFVINADGSGVRRLASSGGIDTEPRYSADGQYLYFTSDRGGSPQVYRMPAGGGDAQRVTFEGSYNVTPRPSPDGKSLAYISRNEGRFQLTLMDLATRQTQILTDSSKDESPSFSPNGRMILYASEIGGRGVLAATSLDGRVKQKLSIPASDVREPAWGPSSK